MIARRLGSFAVCWVALFCLACPAPRQEPKAAPAPVPITSAPAPAPRTPAPATTAPAAMPVAPTPPGSFERAKQLAVRIYADHRMTLYCSCAYSSDQRVLAQTCGYAPKTASHRGRRIEWEHIVPAYSFGAHRACWRGKACVDSKGRAYGGRRCCRKRDAEFRRMEADLQNLTPEIGELNAARSRFAFGEVEGEPRLYGACDFEVSPLTETAEPPRAVRGEIARAYLYMLRVYGPGALPLASPDVERFQRWHRADPPTAWERVRDARIEKIQRTGNPFLRE